MGPPGPGVFREKRHQCGDTAQLCPSTHSLSSGCHHGVARCPQRLRRGPCVAPRQPTQSSSAGREGPVHTLALAQGLCPVCQGLLFRVLRHVGKFPLSSRGVGLGCPFAWNVLSSSVLIPQNRQVEVEILCQKASALLSRVLRTATWCPEGPGQRECHQQRAKAPLPSLCPQHESQHPGCLQFGE